MKILEIAKKMWANCKAFWLWVRICPRNAVISAGVFLAVILGLVLFVKIVLPILLLIAFVVWLFFGDTISAFLAALLTPPLALDDDGVAWEVTTFFHGAASSAGDVLTGFVSAAATANDLFDGADYRGTYNNVPILKLHMLRKQKDITPDDCSYIKNALQGAVSARLRDGHLVGYVWAIPAAGNVPLIKIAAVTCSATYIHIDILLTNTPESVKAARISDKPAPPPSVDGTDPLFRKGDD